MSLMDDHSYLASLIPLGIIGAKRFYSVLVAVLSKYNTLVYIALLRSSFYLLTKTPLQNQMSSATGQLYSQLSFSPNILSSARTLILIGSRIGINRVNYQ